MVRRPFALGGGLIWPGAILIAAMLTAGSALAGDGPTSAELHAAGASTDWMLPNHDYATQRYVPLTQITRANAAALRAVCWYDIQDVSRFGAGPLVYRGVMFVTSGDTTVALDAATCALRWRHVWRGTGASGDGGPPRTVQNAFKSRGASIQAGKLVRATSDSNLIALDAATGKLAWARPVASAGRYEFVTMAPLIIDDLVIAGVGISEYAVKGWIGAFRLSDGEPVWRFNTVPDEGEAGSDSWSEVEARERGGGGVWVTPAYDADSGLLYVAVGNPVPDFFGDVREGANLYTGSLIALEVATGKLRWHRQVVPHDLHDWDLTVAGPVYRSDVGGEARTLIAVGGKDGILRAIDRESREQVFQTPVTSQDNVGAAPTVSGVRACPGVLGGMQWSNPAYMPALNLLVAPSVDWCGTYRKSDDLRHVRGQLYLGGSFSFDAGGSGGGWLTAVDATTGDVKWRYESVRPMLAAVTTTASGLVFTGELNGDVLALDGRDGSVLYRHDTGMPLHAGVISYAVDGRQFVAVASGTATSFWRAQPASARVMVFALP